MPEQTIVVNRMNWLIIKRKRTERALKKMRATCDKIAMECGQAYFFLDFLPDCARQAGLFTFSSMEPNEVSS